MERGRTNLPKFDVNRNPPLSAESNRLRPTMEVLLCLLSLFTASVLGLVFTLSWEKKLIEGSTILYLFAKAVKTVSVFMLVAGVVALGNFISALMSSLNRVLEKHKGRTDRQLRQIGIRPQLRIKMYYGEILSNSTNISGSNFALERSHAKFVTTPSKLQASPSYSVFPSPPSPPTFAETSLDTHRFGRYLAFENMVKLLSPTKFHKAHETKTPFVMQVTDWDEEILVIHSNRKRKREDGEDSSTRAAKLRKIGAGQNH